jgi:hypothetical protein
MKHAYLHSREGWELKKLPMIVFSRQVGVVQLAVVGGHLDKTMLNQEQWGDVESRQEEQLRVFILNNRGELFLWENSAIQQLTRCAYL